MKLASGGDSWGIIYINGVKRQGTLGLAYPNSFDGVFYADSDNLPLRRCSCHRLSPGSTAHMINGGSIRTSGNTYSLKGPK